MPNIDTTAKPGTTDIGGLREQLDRIEYRITQGMTAAQVFTQMRQLLTADDGRTARTLSAQGEAVAEVYERFECKRDSLGEAYRESAGPALRFVGEGLPIGTKLYTHPAPARVTEGVDVLRIPAGDKLDAIIVYFEDEKPGQGRMTIACYGDSWTAWWGSMGDRTVRQFVAGCDAGYLSGAMCQLRAANGMHRDYAWRVAARVISALTAALEADHG